MPVSAEPDSPRAVSLRRRLLAGAAALAAVVAAMLVAGWVTSSRAAVSGLRAVLDDLDATDPGWRLHEIEAAREEVPDAENSARLVAEVLRSLPPHWVTRLGGAIWRGQPPESLLSGQGLAAARADLPGLAPLLSHARRLADLPRGRHRITIPDNPYLAHSEPHRNAAASVSLLLAVDALDLAHRGLMAEAVASCRASLNAGRSLGDEPLFWSARARLLAGEISYDAVEGALHLGAAPDDELARLAALLALEQKHPAQRVYLRAKRATIHQALTGVEQGRFPFDGTLNHTSIAPLPRWHWWGGIAPWQVRLEVLKEHPEVLELMTRAVAAADLPAHEQDGPMGDVEREAHRHLTRYDRPVRYQLMHSINGDSREFRRAEALVKALRTAVAAERYRLAHGAWPGKLADLVPAYLDAVPLDPIDGAPLRYARHAEGVTVYSVGLDGTDDGGRIDRKRPRVGGTDVGYRLWDAERRGKPAAGKK
jgi:hypothetical protein